MKEELGKQRLVRGTKGSRKDTLTEDGMILRKRSEEILDLVKKTEHEIMLSDNVMIGVVYIGAGETDGVRLPAKDVLGILIPKDSPLAEKDFISPEDLWGQPLLISQQEAEGGELVQWSFCCPYVFCLSGQCFL